MIFKEIEISGLTAFTQSSEYAEWKHVPISPARALSQSQNPYARPNDVALVLALDENTNKLMGFIGALPSEINNPDKSRVIWVSNWWVDADERGKGIATLLLDRLFELYGNVLCFQDLTIPTLNIIEKKKLYSVIKKSGVQIHLRSGLRLRIRKTFSGKRRFIYKLLYSIRLPHIIDFFLNLIIQKANHDNSILPAEVNFPSKEDYKFLEDSDKYFFHIPKFEETNMSPWLVKYSKTDDYLRLKYPYSSFAEEFSIYWLRWEMNGQIQALVMVSLRDGTLKTQFIFCNPDFEKDFPKAFLAYCFGNKKVYSIMTTYPGLLETHSSKFLIKRNFTRYMAIPKEIEDKFPSPPQFQDGEGDYRFT